MKIQLLLLLTLIAFVPQSYGQVLDLQSSIHVNAFSQETVAAYEACAKVYQSMKDEGRGWKELKDFEKEILNNCEETRESVWDAVGGGCGWYCGAGSKNVVASSTLKTQGNNTYEASNAHDLNYQSAWVEGANGYGIGEYLLYTFSKEHPRIHTIKIANGYVKSETAWRNNSRVKKLNMYVNDTLFAYLNLKDIRIEQHFKVPPIGYNSRSDFQLLKEKEDWTIKFEIAEVYEGDKYDDVVISELFFDGLDVHCFAAGTKVLMADGLQENIEDLVEGQEVMSYNQVTGKYESAIILELANPLHHNLIKLTFSDGSDLMATEDHPFYDGKTWKSYNPEKTQASYQFDDVASLQLGSEVLTTNGTVVVTAIEEMKQEQRTYTIVKLSKNNAFIANGIVVGTEELRQHNEGF